MVTTESIKLPKGGEKKIPSLLWYVIKRLYQLSLHQAWRVEGTHITTPNCGAHGRHG